MNGCIKPKSKYNTEIGADTILLITDIIFPFFRLLNQPDRANTAASAVTISKFHHLSLFNIHANSQNSNPPTTIIANSRNPILALSDTLFISNSHDSVGP